MWGPQLVLAALCFRSYLAFLKIGRFLRSRIFLTYDGIATNDVDMNFTSQQNGGHFLELGFLSLCVRAGKF